VGWLFKDAKGLQWDVAAWYTHFDNAIVTDAFLFDGQDSILFDGEWSRVLANQNRRKAVIYGLTSSLEWDFHRYWSLSVSYTYTRGTLLEGDGNSPLDHIPPVYGKAGLRYKRQGWSTEVYCLFNGKKPIDQYALNGEDNQQYAPDGGMPSWQTVHIRLHYQLNKAWRIQAGVDNLMDVQYRTFSSGINGPGRHLFLALRAQFG
jgi:hemoglobin/transferrin/lactoferrin receptor protein